jgi:glycosyltransferase involved in cell wall biosynthesis
VVLARDKRRLRDALETHGKRHRIVLESHELDSALAREAGEDPAPHAALEACLLERLDALVTNCSGTADLWSEAHPGKLPPTLVSHNATCASRRRGPVSSPDPVVRAVGSLPDYKGLDTLLAAKLPLPLELVGGSAAERSRLQAPEGVRLLPPVPYPVVPDLLSHSRALLLPLADNLFGRSLTSPLKLWDYLATATPIVAPNLPTIREIAALAQTRLHHYEAGDPASIRAAVTAALAAPPRQPFLRTWEERVAELSAVLDGP